MTEDTKRSRWQFNLRAMMGAVILAGIAFGSVRHPSVFAFSLTLLVTVVAGSLATRSAFRKGLNRGFWCGSAIVGWCGVGLTLLARTPIDDTAIVTVMWWHLTKWHGGWFTFNAACFEGDAYLIVTWLAGIFAGAITQQLSHLVAKKEANR